MSNLVIDLSDFTDSSIDLVGGKALSQILLKEHGFNVPGGCVLTTNFFDPWTLDISHWNEWQKLQALSRNEQASQNPTISKTCIEIQERIFELDFTETQRQALNFLNEKTRGVEKFAIRSSCVEEDQIDVSFAGQYESFLDVSKDNWHAAIRDCFASALSTRLVNYKLQHGLALVMPRIAVMVQDLVASEVSGVVFSINPLTNDHDELIVNAAQGLGESLVSGQVTPDSWCVSKVDNQVIDFRSSTVESDAHPCLSDKQLSEVSSKTMEIEQIGGEPVDVEFAFAGDELHILQSRPVTNWVPVPPEMQTKIGDPRVLYLDPNLADGYTLSGSITPLTRDLDRLMWKMFSNHVLTKDFMDLTPGTGFYFASGARTYVNMSKIVDYADPKKFAEGRKLVDTTLSDLYATVDFAGYKAHQKSFSQMAVLLANFFKMSWMLRSLFVSFFRMSLNYPSFQRTYQESIREFEKTLRNLDEKQPVQTLAEELLHAVGRVCLNATAPALIASISGGTMALSRLAKRQSKEVQQLLDDLRMGGDDLVHEMGIAMYKLAHELPLDRYDDLEILKNQIESSVVPESFRIRWQEFSDRFGFRGPMEMDLASPKYDDDPLMLLRQLKYIRSGDSIDPTIIQEEKRKKRAAAIEQLENLTPRRTFRKIQKAFTILTTFQHTRELPKHHLMMLNMKLRTRLLEIADEWVSQGRLDDINDIFELSFDDISRAEEDSQFGIREVLLSKNHFYRKIKKLVRHFPHLMDSRGKILRAKFEQKPGQWTGTPVSPGVASGPARVVHNPNEQSLEPGEVLVAYTTDPGWTPLFINASAIVLEVGGELQHGSLVAREYGKPCVAGVVGAVRTFENGQLVRVDGNSGIIEFVS